MLTVDYCKVKRHVGSVKGERPLWVVSSHLAYAARLDLLNVAFRPIGDGQGLGPGSLHPINRDHLSK